MAEFKGTWQQMWDEAEYFGKFWLIIKQGGDGPIAPLPSGKTVIFPIDPQPPVESYCRITVRKTKDGFFLGQWTGEKAE